MIGAGSVAGGVEIGAGVGGNGMDVAGEAGTGAGGDVNGMAGSGGTGGLASITGGKVLGWLIKA